MSKEPARHTKYAIAYTNERIGALRRSPTWDDVSLAYDAGLTYGVESPRRKQLRSLIHAQYVMVQSDAGAENP